METVKQWGLWSSLGSHGSWFSLVSSVFTPVVKPGIMKFWLEGQGDHPQNNRDLNPVFEIVLDALVDIRSTSKLIFGGLALILVAPMKFRNG